VIAAVQAHYAGQDPKVDTTDGISMEFADWRVNIRSSNTEPLLRLNIEAQGKPALVAEQVGVVEEIIQTAQVQG